MIVRKEQVLICIHEIFVFMKFPFCSPLNQMQESNKQELKLQLKNCRLASCGVLKESLLEVLGVEKSKATIVLQQLLKQGFKTWGDLRCSLLKTPEMTIEAIVGDEVNGKALWNTVWDYENRMAVANNIGQGKLLLLALFNIVQD